jgi:hypothetical protein
MAKSSSLARKVARAAAAGAGHKSNRQITPGWWGSVAVIVLLGLVTVGYSRYELSHPYHPPVIGPTVGQTYQIAFAFDICGTVEPNPPAKPAANGMSTNGSGILQVTPTSAANAGKNATLGKFIAGYPGMALGPSELQYPGQKPYHNGQLCPDGRPGTVQVKEWNSLLDHTGHLVSGDPTDLHLSNDRLLTLAFVPAGTAIPQPPSKGGLSVAVTTTTAPPTSSSTPTTVAPVSSSTVPTGSTTITTTPVGVVGATPST